MQVETASVMAIPEFLSGSYRRYKEDTISFTTWLSQAATAVGWKSTKKLPQDARSTPNADSPTPPRLSSDIIQAPSRRLKGKARKAAKAASQQSSTTADTGYTKTPAKGDVARYILSTQDLLSQAEAVARAAATQADMRMPEDVRLVLERAITARRRCADWFEMAKVEARWSNKGHRHFIDALQRALDLLNWRQEDAKSEVKEEGRHEPDNTVQSLQDQLAAVRVEDMVEESVLACADGPNSGAKTQSKVYELEADAAWEDAFICYCFFQDLHSIQDTLKSVWKKYKDGELDLISATIATQVGIESVHRAEKDLLDANPRLKAYRRDYDSIAMAVFYAESLRNGRDPDEYLNSPESLEVTELEEFIYLPTARVLMKMAQVAKHLDQISWPLPVPQMRFSYIARPELLDFPKYSKLEDEDRLLTQLLQELVLVHLMKKFPGVGSAQLLPSIQDEFSKSLDGLWAKGDINIHNVFASRIMLDIIETIGNRPKHHDDLLRMAKHAKQDFEFQLYPNRSLGTGETRWLARDKNTLMDAYQLIEKHIPYLPVAEFKKMLMEANKHNLGPGYAMDDAPPEIQEAIREHYRKRGRNSSFDGPSEEHKANAKRLNLRPIGPAPEPDFAITHNPLLCGTLALQLALLTEDAGVALSNHHLSIFATAHLYNALRQLKYIQIGWPELDRVMELHAGPLFANDVPDTPEKFYARMAFRLGNSRPTRRLDELQKWKMQITPASKILREYLNSNHTIEGVVQQIQDQLQKHMPGESSDAVAVSSSNIQKKSNNERLHRRRLAPLQFVEVLQSYFPEILPNVTVNYIALTKTCNALMRTLRQRIQDELGIEYTSMADPSDSNDHGFVFMVLKILEETKMKEQAWQSTTKKKNNGEANNFDGGRQLRLAAETVEGYLTSMEKAARR